MKFTFAILVVTLAAFAACQGAAVGGLSPDQVVELIKEVNPDVTCINLQCRLSCIRQGSKAGFCDGTGNCNCVPIVLA